MGLPSATAREEIISRIATDIASGDHFFTDSNGFETMLRTRNHRQTYSINLTEPITANYYPVNTAISIRDASAQLTVTPDRTQGGASLASGEIELLLHRRLLAGDYPCTPDDASGALNCGGVSALNETQSAVYDTDGLVVERLGSGIVVRGTHRLALAPRAQCAPVLDAQAATLEPLLARFSRRASRNATAPRALLAADLPQNVAVVSLELQPNRKILLRLGHRCRVGEDPQLSRPVNVSLGSLFARESGWQIRGVQELSLSANQPLAGMERLQWRTEAVATALEARRNSLPGPRRAPAVAAANFEIELEPLDIRTFELDMF